MLRGKRAASESNEAVRFKLHGMVAPELTGCDQRRVNLDGDLVHLLETAQQRLTAGRNRTVGGNEQPCRRAFETRTARVPNVVSSDNESHICS